MTFETFTKDAPKSEWLQHTYWVLQEIITNAIRHSKVNRIQLSVNNEEDDFCIFIHYRATPEAIAWFDKKAGIKNGMGTLIINDRLEIIGAKLSTRIKDGVMTHLIRIKMKILILDDHDAIRMYVNQLVASIVPNATIFLSNSIESAISSINATSSVDFVICDLELNFGCNTLIPELCCDRKIPCMIYSSHVNMVLIQELEKYHVRSYVSKTSGIEALRSGVDALLNGKNINVRW